jgi:transcriptional regulator with XRE-family HTH domain
MARKPRPNPKPTRKRTFLKEWRKKAGLSQIKASERLLLETETDLSDSQLSRIERGEQGYTQDHLEALAFIYKCEPADLLTKDPRRPDPPRLAILNSLSVDEQEKVAEIVQIMRRTA